MLNGTYIYLNGSGTSQNPYTCQSAMPGHRGIYFSKSISFVGIRSRAYISCFYGSPWLVNGTEIKGGVQVSFSGLTFLNTPLRFVDALVIVSDVVFTETKRVALNVELLNLHRLELSLQNVVFQHNAGCIIIDAEGSIISVNIANTTFYENGKLSSNSPSILRLDSTKNLINIQIKNSTFKKNIFKGNGMIQVINELGTTNLLINQLKMEENEHINPKIKANDGLFALVSSRLFIRLEYGFVYETTATFLAVAGPLVQVNLSNIEVHGFNSATNGGGVVNVFDTDSCNLSIKNSSFRNGNNYGTGGVVSIVAPDTWLIIENSIIQNVTSFRSGGAVYVQSQIDARLKSTNRSKRFMARLHVRNSSFSYSTSKGKGGVMYILAQNLIMIIRDSFFLRNNAGAMSIHATDTAVIHLYNDYFVENSADDGGIVEVIVRPIKSTMKLWVTDVIFARNKLSARPPPGYRILLLYAQSSTFYANLTRTHFFGNMAKNGSNIVFLLGDSGIHRVILDACILRENSGYGGAVAVVGQASVTCAHSIFASNGKVSCTFTTMVLINNLNIFITNTTFDNNFCGAIRIQTNESAFIRMVDSTFVRNKNINHEGGAITLYFTGQTKNSSRIPRAILTNILFKENTSPIGSALSVDVTDGKVTLTYCTFLNNFARFQGEQILTRGLAHLVIKNSMFKQTVQNVCINNTTKFISTAFLRSYSISRLAVYNTTFRRSVKSKEPLILVPTASSVVIDNASLSICPLGRAIEVTNYHYNYDNDQLVFSVTLSCKKCDYNFYSLQSGTARGLTVDDNFKCMSCPRGADCIAAIKSKMNFWGYHISSNPPKLAFTICPFGYCKSPPANSGKYNECQGKRTGIMCGKCSRGYTEALWSTYCTPVKDCNDHWFWVLFFALVFSIAILLVFKPPFVRYFVKQIFWFKKLTRSSSENDETNDDSFPILVDDEHNQENIQLSSAEKLKEDKRQFSQLIEIIFYFYQIAQLLLSSSSLTEFFHTQFLTPVLGFFNFQPSFKKQGFLCPFPGLTPELKLVFKIAPVLGTLAAILLIYALHFCICRMKGDLRPAITSYLHATIKAIFLSYVTLSTVSISLIRCVSVAGKARWFYNGNIICYEWWQYASMIFNAIFVVPFIFVLALVSFQLHHNKITNRQFLLAIICPLPFLLLWLFRLVCSSPTVNVEEDQNLKALKEMLLGPYKKPRRENKRGAFYWQSVLIARRFILVLIFCLVPDQSIRLFFMTIACLAVLCYHLKVKPFQNSFANNLESLSLLVLVILGLVNLFKSVFVGEEENIKGSFVTLMKVFHWFEIVMLGFLPAAFLLLVCFALISFSVRVLFQCFTLIFKCLFTQDTQRRLSPDAPMLYIWDNEE